MGIDTLLIAAFFGFVSAIFMTLTESPFWRRWGMGGVAEWQINWVTLSVLRIIPADENNKVPKASRKVIASHLVHGMIAALVFILILPELLLVFPFARAWVVLIAIGFSLTLWILFSVALKKVYEGLRGIHIQRRGQLVSLLSHSVYGLSLGILVGAYLLQAL